MAEPWGDGEMIEIGDPTEEPTPAEVEAQPRVVIQYHERGGVPWMLIPPLLVASAVAAVLLFHKFAPRPRPIPIASASPVEAPRQPLAAPVTQAPVEAPTPTPVVEKAPIVEAPIVSETPAPVAPPLPVEPIPPAEPKIEGRGFDPKALEAERRVEAPPDPAIAAAAVAGPRDERDLPREVDPDLLPPDPKLARARQQQRRLEALKKVDEDRVKFHAELREICRKFGEVGAPKIHDLQKKYGTQVEPWAEKRAAELLGKNGKFVGADRRTRIELLRALGYPESVILGDLFDRFGMKQVNEREGPRTEGEALYRTALYLLRNPPASDANPSRTISETRPGTNLRALPPTR
jgi:hypothetical protein